MFRKVDLTDIPRHPFRIRTNSITRSHIPIFPSGIIKKTPKMVKKTISLRMKYKPRMTGTRRN